MLSKENAKPKLSKEFNRNQAVVKWMSVRERVLLAQHKMNNKQKQYHRINHGIVKYILGTNNKIIIIINRTW